MADMTRRGFLKLSVLFAGAMALEANPILQAASKLAESNPVSVLIYKIWDRKNRRWTIKGTKYTNLNSGKISRQKYDAKTFQVLAIVDNSEAESTRRKLWSEHSIKQRYPDGYPLDVVKCTELAFKGGGKNLGQRWKDMCAAKDPRVKEQCTLAGKASQKTRRENPDIAQRIAAATILGTLRSKTENPEMWEKMYEQRGKAYSKWCKENPESASRIGKKRAAKSKEWFAVPENASKARAWQSEAGKKGQVTQQKYYKENPEIHKAHVKKAADAAAAKSIERMKMRVQQLYDALPEVFTRPGAYEMAKQLGLPGNTATRIMNDPTLSIGGNDRQNTGNGRGSSIKQWTKVKQS